MVRLDRDSCVRVGAQTPETSRWRRWMTRCGWLCSRLMLLLLTDAVGGQLMPDFCRINCLQWCFSSVKTRDVHSAANVGTVQDCWSEWRTATGYLYERWRCALFGQLSLRYSCACTSSARRVTLSGSATWPGRSDFPAICCTTHRASPSPAPSHSLLTRSTPTNRWRIQRVF